MRLVFALTALGLRLRAVTCTTLWSQDARTRGALLGRLVRDGVRP